MDSHYGIMWGNNSGENLGRRPTEYYVGASDDAQKRKIIYQKLLISNILRLSIRNLLTADVNCKLRAYKTFYSYTRKHDWTAMVFVIFKMVCPDMCVDYSYIKMKLLATRTYKFNNYIPKANLHITLLINKI